VGNIDNSRGGGREKIRRFWMVMALARQVVGRGGGLLFFSQPFSSPLALQFAFFLAVLAGPVILGGQPAGMASSGASALGTAVA
jgi:hypothetical protein